MSVSAQYALRAIVRGLGKSGALTVEQLNAILHELEAAAVALEERGRKSDAAEVRELIERAFRESD